MNLSQLRIGIGHDTHRLQPGGPLRLGGINIDHDLCLIGHSDADVLLHAVTDAILGAAGLGDIGDLFPDTSPENENRDSAEMLAIALERAQESGHDVVNLDCIVFAQRPKLTPHKQAMVQRIAAIVNIAPNRVNVKAKTGEHVGAVGQQQAMMAQCIALLVKHGDAPDEQ
jgi:2-C-methyl-D-erythritol 2,4-cyclodiphosphate synthase